MNEFKFETKSESGTRAVASLVMIVVVFGLALGSCVAAIIVPIKGACWLMGGCL